MENPSVVQTARKSIVPVATEVVVGTSLLGWAMLSLPHSARDTLNSRWEDMVRFLAEHYGTARFGGDFGHIFGFVVGVITGLLLLSAVNTAIGAMIGLTYMLSRDGEMPKNFTRLNTHGVPWVPLCIAVILPFVVTIIAPNLESLAGLYAIGVVGAITVNLGSCTFNRRLDLLWHERILMGITFFILFAVELTIARTQSDALFFAVCVLGIGFALRSYAQRRAGLRTLTVSHQIAAHVVPESAPDWQLKLTEGQSILVAARGLTPVLRFALEEARLRKAMLYVLYVKEIAVNLPGRIDIPDKSRWQDDKEASTIMCSMIELGRQNEVTVIPLYAISENPASTILDLSATLGIDFLMLGARHRRTLAQMFKGDVANQVAKELPENIELVIHG
jgi:nucleotide-binding universal stress UspA family protein